MRLNLIIWKSESLLNFNLVFISKLVESKKVIVFFKDWFSGRNHLRVRPDRLQPGGRVVQQLHDLPQGQRRPSSFWGIQENQNCSEGHYCFVILKAFKLSSLYFCVTVICPYFCLYFNLLSILTSSIQCQGSNPMIWQGVTWSNFTWSNQLIESF